MSGRAARQRGLALVLVLWVVVLLSLIAAAFLGETRSGLQAAQQRRDLARAEALADAGVHWAIWRLLQGAQGAGARPGLPLDGRPVRRRVGAQAGDHGREGDGDGGGVVEVRVRDVFGRIDINVADMATLRRLFGAVGVEPARARVLAARILDYRDADSDPRADGAEDAAYVRGSAAAGAADGRFTNPAELAMVLGIDATLAARLRPHVTVRAGTRALDPAAATPIALRAALAERESARLRAYLDARAAAPYGQGPAPPPGANLVRSPRHSVTIRARGEAPGEAVFTRVATVRLDSRQGGAPYTILAWRQAVPLTGEAPGIAQDGSESGGDTAYLDPGGPTGGPDGR